MKQTILLFFLSLVALSSFSQTWIRSDDAKHFRGDVINIVGLVTEVKRVSGKGEAAKHIKLAGKEAGNALTLVILKADLGKFEGIAGDLLHQYIHVKGKVIKKKGKPYIILSSPSQVSIAREMEMQTFEPL